MRQQQQHESSGLNPRESLAFVIWICGVFAVGSEVFLHKTHGRKWPGMQGVRGLIAILFFPLLFPDQDVTPLLWLLVAYIAACAAGRISVLGRRDDCLVHSRYNGTPRMMRFLPFLSESTIKRFVEPALVFAVGLVVLNLSRPLGIYLLLSAWGLAISTNAAEWYWREQVGILNDSMLEQREIAERFRQLQDKYK